MSRPDWLVPGAAVVEFTDSRGMGSATIEETTIVKVLKRNVVLENGRRYNADVLVKRNGSWDPSTFLLSADDPKIAVARAKNLENRRANQMRSAWEALRSDRSVEKADALIQAVEAWKETQS